LLAVFTQTCPAPPPGAAWADGAGLDVEPAAAAVAAVVGAAAAGAVLAGAVLAAVLVLAEADLLIPPWPLHAPRPPCGEVVPSLQVTGPLLAEEPLLLAEEAEEAPAAGALDAAAGAAAPLEADLFTPP
jgi:hypothetical protein